LKARKSQALLLLYENLLEKKTICKEDCLSFLDVSDLTFKRYISELRAYLANFHPEKSIAYDRKHRHYCLKDEEKFLSILF